jgi:hypothetical protein
MKKMSRPANKLNAEPAPSNMDLFLNEDALIQLARAHRRGSMPPQQSTHGSKSNQISENYSHLGSRSLLARELEGRGWTPRDLSRAIGLSESECMALAKGNVRMREEHAILLARCFATSPDFWL